MPTPVSAFWDNLARGKESIVTLSEQELGAAGVGDKTLANPSYVRRAPLLDGVDEFDAEFFGFPPQARPDAGPPTPIVPAMRMARTRGRRL